MILGESEMDSKLNTVPKSSRRVALHCVRCFFLHRYDVCLPFHVVFEFFPGEDLQQIFSSQFKLELGERLGPLPIAASNCFLLAPRKNVNVLVIVMVEVKAIITAIVVGRFCAWPLSWLSSFLKSWPSSSSQPSSLSFA